MICINFTELFDFEYDIQGIVRSYYPEEPLKSVLKNEKAPQEDVRLNLWCTFGTEHMSLRLIDMADTCLQAEFDRVIVDGNDRRKETKNRLKRELYALFKTYTGKDLPWGTLSGIRPTKITSVLLEEGMTPQAVYAHMQQEYYLSDQKAKESIAISEREISLLKKIDYQNGYSLYIGIPFCPSTCLYCSFTSYPIGRYQSKTDIYLDALMKELTFCAELYRDKRLCTIYIGGGTPTSLSAAQLDRLLLHISRLYDTKKLYEFTVEAGRPDSITREKLQVIRQYDVTRISVNPQTMNDETLQFIGRHHDVQQFLQVYEMAREEGFTNINMDFILGLPNEQLREVAHSMEYVLKLKPDSLTIHSLAVKRAARLTFEKRLGRKFEITNDEKIMQLTRDTAAQLDMHPYYLYRQKNMAGNLENVGYALDGKECLYNILIMEERQTILAAGAGASTKLVRHRAENEQPDVGDEITRVENVKNVDHYIDKIDEMIERKRRVINISERIG